MQVSEHLFELLLPSHYWPISGRIPTWFLRTKADLIKQLGHRVPTLKEAHKWWQYEPKGTAIIHFLISLEKSKPENKEDPTIKHGNIKENKISEPGDTQEDKPSKPNDVKDENIRSTIRNHATYDPFMDASNQALLDINFESELTNGRRASRGLPPDFIRKWCLDRVFTKDEDQVDFDQALTGIDYLQDLECRRREALREVALRLKIDKHNWRRVLSADPDAKKWVEDIQAQETIIEGFYATCFVDLRIWVCECASSRSLVMLTLNLIDNAP